MTSTCLGALSLLSGVRVASAMSGGINDSDTPQNNATVSLDGGACTGALIAPQLVMTAGHCRGNVSTGRELDGTRVPMGQWVKLTTPFTVRVGTSTASADTAHTYTATFMTQAGWADIQIIMLDRAVPATQAIPARPLTHASANESRPGFWESQGFTVTGYGGGRASRQTAAWRRGAFPCKNASGLIANDEMFCGLVHNGAELEGGDSGSPLYWVDPTGARRVIGVYQGNVQALRVCDPAHDGAGIACQTDTEPVLSPNPLTGCREQTATTTSYSAWSPMHHTATFFNGGGCWKDTSGVTRHQPDIGAWIDDAILYAPSANDHLVDMVLQRSSTGRFDIVAAPGGEFTTVLTGATFENARAPNLFTNAETLWEWQVDGAPGKVLYTTQFQGDHFSHPSMFLDGIGQITFNSPRLVARVFRRPDGLANPVALKTYFKGSTREFLTTWSLADSVPDAAARSQWSLISEPGFVSLRFPIHANIAPAAAKGGQPPLRNPPMLVPHP